jgi:hypothetical protein
MPRQWIPTNSDRSPPREVLLGGVLLIALIPLAFFPKGVLFFEARIVEALALTHEPLLNVGEAADELLDGLPQRIFGIRT